MPFRLTLYRAEQGLGPLDSWECEHREPLGTLEELKASIEGVFPGTSWEESDGMSRASCSFEGNDDACEITLFGTPGETLLDVSIYAAPPPVRALMSALDLNYCHASESGELYFPFDAGDRWPGGAR